MGTDCANSILRQNHVSEDASSPPPTIGTAWTNPFLERHPQFYIRKQKSLEQERKKVHDPEIILNWCQHFQLLCEEKGILKQVIYNFDKTGFRMGVGRDDWILTLNPKWQSYLPNSTNRELITCCQVISGDGHVLQPVSGVILPGVLHLEDWTTKTKLEDHVLLAVSESAYSNDLLCLEWLKHLERFSAVRQVGVYRLLLLDGFGSHCTCKFIAFCDRNKIIPFCLPPHSTHLIQRLDIVVFQPLKHFHAEAIASATRTGCLDFNKIELLSALRSI